jgi:hypothetical protein
MQERRVRVCGARGVGGCRSSERAESRKAGDSDSRVRLRAVWVEMSSLLEER